MEQHHLPSSRDPTQQTQPPTSMFNPSTSGNMPQFTMPFDPMNASGMPGASPGTNPLHQTIMSMSLQHLSNQFRTGGNNNQQYMMPPQNNIQNNHNNMYQMQQQQQLQQQCMFPTGNTPTSSMPSWANYMNSPQQHLDPMAAFLNNHQQQPTAPKLNGNNNNTNLNSLSSFDLLMSPTLNSAASQLLPQSNNANRQLFSNNMNANNNGSVLSSYPNAPTPAFTQPNYNNNNNQHQPQMDINQLTGYLPMQHQTVDTVEEAVQNLGRDYNLDNDLVMNDYTNEHEHLYHDAFLGAAPQQPQQQQQQLQQQHQLQQPSAIVPNAVSLASTIQSRGHTVNTNDQSMALAARHHPPNAVNHQASTPNEANDPASLIHSIFDFDPESLAVPSTSTAFDTEHTPEKYSKEDCTDPTLSSLTPNTNSAPIIAENTPRHKEKIKQRRDRELAEIDRAFDRHLSMVAEKNARAMAHNQNVLLPALPTEADTALHDEVMDDATMSRSPSPLASTSTAPMGVPSSSRAGTSLRVHTPRPNVPFSPARFSPVRFSPEHGNSLPAEMLFGLPPTQQEKRDDIQVFIPADDNQGKKMEGRKKLPIYCLALSPKSSNALSGVKLEIDVVNDVPPPPTAEDAYDFDDFDEEPFIPEAMPVTPNHKKGTRNHSRATTMANRSAGSVKDDSMLSPKSDGGADLWRHVVPKKRHAITDEQTVPAAPLLPPDAQTASGSSQPAVKPIPREKTTGELLAERLTDTIRRRREYRKIHNYLLSEAQSCKQSVTVHCANSQSTPSKVVAKAIVSAPKTRGAAMRTNTLGQTQSVIDLVDEKPAIPKVVIRIPKLFASIKKEPDEISEQLNGHDNEESEEARRARKKKHKKEKKEKKRAKRDKSAESHHSSLDTSAQHNGHHLLTNQLQEQQNSSQSASNLPHFSKKRRIMDEWAKESEARDPIHQSDPSITNIDENSNDHASVASTCSTSHTSNTNIETSHKSHKDKSRKHHHRRKTEKTRNYEVFISEDPMIILTRLSHFQMPLETLQKGQFVVAKCDLDDAQCPLWKVDNQNLLQKFPPEDHRGQILYRNSSTYAGWCQQNAYRYVSVSVRFIKHSRSEWLVQPETPLIELLPAVLDTINPEEPVLEDDNETAVDGNFEIPVIREKDREPGEINSADQPLRDALETYLHALLMQCLNGNFLDTIRANNDYKYLRHINDINQLNKQKMQRLLLENRWNAEFRQSLDSYTDCRVESIVDITDSAECQACEASAVSHNLQTFGDAAYDQNTFQPKLGRRSGSGSPIPAQEYRVCSKCASAAQSYHRLTHVPYKMYSAAEAQIELVRAENDRVEPTTVLDECLRNRTWMSHVVCDVLGLWRKVTEETTLSAS